MARRAGRRRESAGRLTPRSGASAAHPAPSATSSALTLSRNAEPRRLSSVSRGAARACSTAARNGANASARNGESRSRKPQVARQRRRVRQRGAAGLLGAPARQVARRDVVACNPAALDCRPQPGGRVLRRLERGFAVLCRARPPGSGNPVCPSRRATPGPALSPPRRGTQVGEIVVPQPLVAPGDDGKGRRDQHRDRPRHARATAREAGRSERQRVGLARHPRRRSEGRQYPARDQPGRRPRRRSSGHRAGPARRKLDSAIADAPKTVVSTANRSVGPIRANVSASRSPRAAWINA